MNEGLEHVPADLPFLRGGGGMGELMRRHAWRGTPLGDPATWPAALTSTLGLCLDSAFPIAIYWGPELALLYNDAWKPILGDKHPWALGRPARVVWPEIWESIDPVFRKVMETGTGVFNGDSLLAMHRHGYLEECYFDYTFNPIRSGAGDRVGGIFNVVIETTYRVTNERRSRLQRDFAARVNGARTDTEVIERAAEVLEEAKLDVPFALFFRCDAENRYRLVRTVGALSAPASQPETWPLREALAAGNIAVLDAIEARAGALPGGAWPERTRQAVIVPVRMTREPPRIAMVSGVSPRRAFDDQYQAFFTSLSDHMASALTSAAAFEAERARAESLAQLDRAKTTFFSNVSHEFRTPLTLMLGPLEELRARESGEARESLAMIHRNGQRLLKLVNTLLDFARIEAGRAQAAYELTDLAALTTVLASNFRSACEQAGLKLEVDCAGSCGEVWVDREMWEKIVLNLLSNAFKFTLEGCITVRLQDAGERLRLTVEDTGVGISRASLPRIFERFHRVEETRGRSHEGSGIGLALVQELVRLHGGTISVDSEPGRGTLFAVEIPRGSAHLPADRLGVRGDDGRSGLRAEAYVREVMGWLPDTAPRASASRTVEQIANLPRVLVADDNADLREYAVRLLSPHYEVEAVQDGAQALAAAHERRPDLIVTDVMMPNLDGFGLIRELRALPALRDIPVIVLSARAGEEARVEGLGRGADDYLVKPFGARELRGRVEALLRSSAIRRDIEAQLRLVTDQAPVLLLHCDKQTRYKFVSAPYAARFGLRPEQCVGRRIRDVLGDTAFEAVRPSVEAVLRGERIETEQLVDFTFGPRWMHAIYVPERDGNAEVVGFVAVVQDVTARKQAEERLRESEERFRSTFENAAAGIAHVAPDGRWMSVNERLCQLVGYTREELFTKTFADITHPDDIDADWAQARRLLAGEIERYTMEKRYIHKDGSVVPIQLTVGLSRKASGEPDYFISVIEDISVRKRAEEALREEAHMLETLNSVGKTLNAELDLEKTVQAVTDAATALSGAQFGAFFYNVTNAQGEAYLLYTLSGARREDFERFGTPRNTAVFAPTFRGEAVVRLDDVTQDPRFGHNAPHYGMPKGHLPVRSYLAAAVVSRSGEVLGGLFFGHSRPGVFTERAERLVTGIAAQAAVAIDNARLYAESRRLVGELRESDRIKDEFLATLAHELRNPLAPLKNAMYLLQPLEAAEARLRPMREMMERQIDQLVRLVDDLLDLSRITRGSLELKSETVEVADIAHAAMETATPAIRAAAHRFDVSVPGEPLRVCGDPLRLGQVLANLLNNAARYTDPGGRISLDVQREGEWVRFCVRDTGIGIAAEAIPDLFRMFARSEAARRRNQSGLGIGLALARRLAEMHGGTLEARSEGVGKGAEFVLQLPLAAKNLPSRPAHLPDAALVHPPGAERRILVVDDNVDAAESLAMVLRMLGAEVKVATSGADALAVYPAFEPAVTFLDIGMPGMDGYEAARAIRTRFPALRSALVALTGWGQEHDRRKSRDAGFDHHLVKPADVSAIEKLLTSLPLH